MCTICRDLSREEIETALLSGLSTPDTARQFHLSPDTIYFFLKRCKTANPTLIDKIKAAQRKRKSCYLCAHGYGDAAREILLLGHGTRGAALALGIGAVTVGKHIKSCLSPSDVAAIHAASLEMAKRKLSASCAERFAVSTASQRRQVDPVTGRFISGLPKTNTEKIAIAPIERDAPAVNFSWGMHVATEAKGIASFIALGDSVAKLRATIAVSLTERRELAKITDPITLSRVIESRNAVLREFDTLISSPDFPQFLAETRKKRAEVIATYREETAAHKIYRKEWEKRQEAEREQEEEEEVFA